MQRLVLCIRKKRLENKAVAGRKVNFRLIDGVFCQTLQISDLPGVDKEASYFTKILLHICLSDSSVMFTEIKKFELEFP